MKYFLLTQFKRTKEDIFFNYPQNRDHVFSFYDSLIVIPDNRMSLIINIREYFLKTYDNLKLSKIRTVEELEIAVKERGAKTTNLVPRYILELTQEDVRNLGITVPKLFHAGPTEVIKKVQEGITDKVIEQFSTPRVVIGDLDKVKSDDPIEKIYDRYKTVCSNCGAVVEYKTKGECPHCKKTLSNQHMIINDYKDYLGCKEGIEPPYGTISSCKNSIFLVKKHPSETNGLIIQKIERGVSLKPGKIISKYDIKYTFEYVLGKKNTVIKHKRGGDVEADLFEMFGINSYSVSCISNVIYEDYDQFMDFLNDNLELLSKIGFQTMLQNMKETVFSIETSLLIYLATLNKYPSIEQIVKGHCPRIFIDLYSSICHSENKKEINYKIEGMSKLIDPDATKDKNALRIPSFIQDYLEKKGAQLDEYFYWCDIYELTHITNGEFEKLINSMQFSIINAYLNTRDFLKLINILKFDYSLGKLLNYIIKNAETWYANPGSSISYSMVIDTLADYLNMCDFSGITPDKYPSDLIKIHNDLLKYYNDRRKERDIEILKNIANECREYVIPEQDQIGQIGIPKLFADYSVIFPETREDFINEGNMQHNCVGSYPNLVKNGNSVIFFIRKKTDPNTSFITAEARKYGLGQCMYSNNRPVLPGEFKKFASYICRKINMGVASGKIHALDAIPKM